MTDVADAACRTAQNGLTGIALIRTRMSGHDRQAASDLLAALDRGELAAVAVELADMAGGFLSMANPDAGEGWLTFALERFATRLRHVVATGGVCGCGQCAEFRETLGAEPPHI